MLTVLLGIRERIAARLEAAALAVRVSPPDLGPAPPPRAMLHTWSGLMLQHGASDVFAELSELAETTTPHGEL